MNINRITVGLAQDHTILHNPELALEKAEFWLKQARDKGVSLIIFPEAWIGGYPKGSSFDTVVGMRTPEGRAEFARYYAGAIDIPGDISQRLGMLIREYSMYAVVGVIERRKSTLFCSTIIFNPEGEIEAVHRKLMPTAMERLIWGQGSGADLPAVSTPFGTIGSTICWENYMPMLRMTMYNKGVTIYCVSTVDDREQWQATMQHIALEGRCFVLSCCAWQQVKHCPGHQTVQGDELDVTMIRGGSVIWSPLGEKLAGPLYDEAGLVTAELNLSEIPASRYDFDPVGHYARPDIFQLTVNERKTNAVETESDPLE